MESLGSCDLGVCCCESLVSSPWYGNASSCYNGVRDNGELAVDCGGPCPMCPVTVSTLAPSDPTVHCSDAVKNFDELGVDCGGVCLPCPSCFDGVLNQGELDVDCGGPCSACGVVVVKPLLKVEGPSNALSGDNVTYCVYGEDGGKVRSLVTVVYANGSIVQYYTDDEGCLTLLVDVPGVVSVTASQLGFVPGVVRLSVWNRVAAVAAVAASSLFSVFLLSLGLYYVFVLPKRVIVSAGSLKSLVEKGLLDKYKMLYVTERVFNSMPDLPAGKVKMVSLSDSEMDEASKLSDEYGISQSDAETIILGKKLRAKQILLTGIPDELKKKYKIKEK